MKTATPESRDRGPIEECDDLAYEYKMLELLEARVELYATSSVEFWDDSIRIRECRDRIARITKENYDAILEQTHNDR